MRQRHVEPVEPVRRLVAVVAVAVPAPAGREHHVAGLHRRLLAVDGRVRALAIDDHAQRVRRMPVRTRVLAGQDHLIGAHQGTAGLVGGQRRRIAHHQVAALGERNVDQPPGGVEPGLGIFIGPVRGHELRPRLLPQDGLLALHPARCEVDAPGDLVECLERRNFATRQALPRSGDGSHGHEGTS